MTDPKLHRHYIQVWHFCLA